MPELKQFQDLVPADFQRFPVWVGVHNLDFGEPWYEGTNEGTCRPWTGLFPVPAKPGFVWLVATFELHDGSSYPGFVRAMPEDWDVSPRRRMSNGEFLQLRSPSARLGGSPLALLRSQSPHIFVRGQLFSFWGSFWSLRPEKSREKVKYLMERRQAFYKTVGKDPADVFPIDFRADPKLATGILSGQLEGFYRVGAPGEVPQIEQ